MRDGAGLSREQKNRLLMSPAPAESGGVALCGYCCYCFFLWSMFLTSTFFTIFYVFLLNRGQMLTTNDIHTYLNSLNDELGQLGVKGELCLFGGAVMSPKGLLCALSCLPSSSEHERCGCDF